MARLRLLAGDGAGQAGVHGVEYYGRWRFLSYFGFRHVAVQVAHVLVCVKSRAGGSCCCVAQAGCRRCSPRLSGVQYKRPLAVYVHSHCRMKFSTQAVVVYGCVTP